MKKTEVLIVRLSPSEKNKLIKNAIDEKLSMSSYIRKKLNLDDEY